MKRKVYWKDLFGSFTHSKGRFLSILTLMLLGSLALVGLKVTTPNMHRTANQFIQQQKMLDLAVMGDLGLDQVDQEELLGLKGTRDQGASAQKRRATRSSEFLGGSLSIRGYPHT